MTSVFTQKSRVTRYASLMACVLACAFVITLVAPRWAFADVRSTDVICGETVEARGFPTGICPSIEANHAILVDDTGKVYFERSAHDPVKIASITKVMTAIVALEYDPTLSLEVYVTAEAAEIGESSAGLAEGDRMTMLNALTAMMVASGNDAAESIATSVGRQMLADEGIAVTDDGQCVQRFVQAMNDKAVAMGLENTYFTNPHGLDDGVYAADMHSTAADVAAEVDYAMGNDVFRAIVRTSSTTVTAHRDSENIEIELTSTDELLDTYAGTVGVKTGTTNEAGACFAGANDHDGHLFYAIVLDSTDEYQRFLDTADLWDWCYSHWVDYPLSHSEETMDAVIGEVQASYPVIARVSHTDWPDQTVAATIADPQAVVHVFALDGNISQVAEFQQLTGNVHVGDTVGTLTFKQRNQVIATVDLVAAEDSWAPDPITGIGIWWQRLWGDDTVAESYLVNQTPTLIDKTQITPAG